MLWVLKIVSLVAHQCELCIDQLQVNRQQTTQGLRYHDSRVGEFEVLVVRYIPPLIEGVESLVHTHQRPSILEVLFNTAHAHLDQPEESSAILL